MKRFIQILLSTLLVISLLGFAAAASLNDIFGTPDNLKQSLQDSGLYDNLADNLTDAALEAAKNERLDLPQDAVRQAANEAFTSELLQESTENLTDGTYNWLQGRVDKPDFRIDLTEAKRKFADTLGDLAAKRIEALPECTLSELRQMQGVTIEEAIFTIQCQPPGFDSEEAKEQVSQSVYTSDAFLEETVITADNLPTNEQGQSVFEQYSDAPDRFQQIMNSYRTLGLASLLLAGVLALLARPRHKALRQLGAVLVVAGLLVVILAFITGGAAGTSNLNIELGSEYSYLEPALTGVAQSLTVAYSDQLIRYGIIYVFGGILLLVGYFLVRKRKVSKE